MRTYKVMDSSLMTQIAPEAQIGITVILVYTGSEKVEEIFPF